jgi:peroxiredoxin
MRYRMPIPGVPRHVPTSLKRQRRDRSFAGASGLSGSAIAVLAFLGVPVIAADAPARPVLHLINDSTVPGELRASPDPNVIRWRSPVFAEPLEFPLSAVRSVHYDTPVTPPKPADEYGVELVGDDVVYGDILRLTDDELELNSAAHGRLRLKRDQVCRIYRLKEAAAVYVGPNGLAGWKDGTEPPQWREEGGQILTDKTGASLYADLNIPEKAVVEIELSWRLKPDFTFALNVAENDHTARSAFRFEVWDGQLVVVGESPRDADAAVIEPAGAIGGHVRVLAYVDRPQDKLILVSRSGKLLATLNITPGRKPRKQKGAGAGFLRAFNLGGGGQPVAGNPTGVRLTNHSGDVRLENLRVSRWNGVPPQDARADQARLHRTDGSIVYGQLTAFDPKAQQFTFRNGGSDTVIGKDAFADIFLPTAAKQPAAAARALRIVYADGSRLSGLPTRIEDDHVTLTAPGLKEPIRLPLAGARAVVPLKRAGKPTTATADGRAGRLEFDGASLKGRLVDGPASLVWQADLAAKPVPLVAGLSGRIVYHEVPPKPAMPKPQTGLIRGQIAVAAPAMMVINGRVVNQPTPSTAPPLPSTGTRSMHLRTGDTVPCEVVRIDEKGVTFRTPSTDATFVPNDKIKSVELIPTSNAPSLDEAKRDRLLTLPRMQKNNAPTHLICSKNGDFLRGRIVEMDEAKLKVDVRLETKEIPRDRVAQIIWLHADELGDAKPAPPEPGTAKQTLAQAINSKGNRLTFVLNKFDGKTISGTSEVLGACRADLNEVDELLFGPAIEQSAAKLAYHDWKLHHAPEPKFVTADAGGGDAAAGIESALVGQPAPAFQLDYLDGSKFRLADRKGRVVVLDFWATWCGPCMQAMPGTEDVIREFSDKGVELLAVNMEEQPDQVKAVMERHKFKAPVAIDRDGAVAAKYAVTAIPQTVVIDREGKVVRLFVGGGKATAEGLKKALQELTAKP